MKKHSTNHLLEILSELAKAKVKFIVCGGVAVVLHGVERMTVDLDVILDFDAQNVKAFLKTIKRLGLIPRVPVSPEILLHETQRELLIKDKKAIVFTFLDPDNPFRMVDVLLGKDTSYTSLYSGSENKRIGKYSIRVASKHQIIAMKKKVKPLRDKDRFDIRALDRL